MLSELRVVSCVPSTGTQVSRRELRPPGHARRRSPQLNPYGLGMLQSYKSPSVQLEEEELPHYAPHSAGQSPAELWVMAVGFIRRQWPIVLSGVLLTIALAAVYLFTTPPLYTGQASILIDTGKVDVFQKSILNDAVNAGMVDTQLEILKSENFALSVIKDLGLTQDPEFVGSSKGLIGSVLDLLLPERSDSASDLTRRAVGHLSVG